MAIQQNIAEDASQFGISFNNAYYRIVAAGVNRTPNPDLTFHVTIQLLAYATPTPDMNTRDVDVKCYDAALADIEAKTGDTFLAKCYAWVMAQEDMDDSTAV